MKLVINVLFYRMLVNISLLEVLNTCLTNYLTTHSMLYMIYAASNMQGKA